MIRQQTLMKYIRNKKGIPIGILVGVKNQRGFSVGYSLCSNKDTFERDMGLKIAYGRADTWEAIPHDTPREIAKNLPDFIERCKKYFKTNNAPIHQDFFKTNSKTLRKKQKCN